jgi:hypothetical protein
MELIGIFLVASGLLAIAGAAKAVRPEDTARALILLLPGPLSRALSLKFMRRAVRVGAALEAALGTTALLFPGPFTACLVAASYLLFVCVVAYAKRHGGTLATCGCFGRPDTPPTSVHLLLNIVFAATAIAVATLPPNAATLTTLLGRQPWDGMPLLLAASLGVWLSYLAMSPMAVLESARRLGQRPTRKAVPA